MNNQQTVATQQPTQPSEGTPFECRLDQGFQQWLSQANGSVAVTTYQAGKVLLAGWNGQQVSMLLRHFEKPMGIAIKEDQLALVTKRNVIVFENSNTLASTYSPNEPGRYDALFLPRMSYHTGDLHLHDLAYSDEGLWTINTRFSALGLLSDKHTFVPKWQPPFISQLYPEDRCHLNGLAMYNGRPRTVSVLGETDEPGGWRENKAAGGALIDIETGETIVRDLSMPHSPRWYKNELWFLNSGHGQLCRMDGNGMTYSIVGHLPGYTRGLTFVGDVALVGLSTVREKHIFGGLPIQDKFSQLQCSVAAVDLNSGVILGTLEFTSGCSELYDVAFMPGVLRGNILNLEKEDAQFAFTSPDISYWLRPENFEDIK